MSNSSSCPTIVGAPRAAAVSFDRPYNARLDDPHNFLYTEYPMVRWLEAQGYDVSYSTDLDTHRSGRSGAANALLQHRVFLISGHDEYWSAEMRAAVTAARKAGVHIAVFSANTGYWKVRMTPSGLGVPDRIMGSYKTSETAGSAVDPAGSTSTWRDPAGPNDPENGLLGVQYIGDNDTLTFPLRISAEQGRDRVYRHTDLQSLPEGTFVEVGKHLVGWEWDAVTDNGHSPERLEVLAESPVVGALLTGKGTESERSLRAARVHAVRQTAPSGSMLFNAGTIKWAWGLEWFEPNFYIQQITYNVLADMGAQPSTPDSTLVVDTSAPPAAVVSSPLDRSTPVRAGDLVPPVVPEVVLSVLGTAIEVTWRTKTPAFGQVWIGTSPDFISDILGTDVEPGTKHVFQMGGLEPNTRYYYQIVSIGESGSLTLFPSSEFRTGRATVVERLRRATAAVQPVACAVRPTLRPMWQQVRSSTSASVAAVAALLAALAAFAVVRRRRRDVAI